MRKTLRELKNIKGIDVDTQSVVVETYESESEDGELRGNASYYVEIDPKAFWKFVRDTFGQRGVALNWRCADEPEKLDE